MGKIIKNGVVYGGKTTIAGNISYDNTSSRLNSSTVQNAITELKELADAATSQVTTLPTASAANLNKIYQYIGTTDANYTNGYFYKCVNDNGTYKWIEVTVQNEVGKKDITGGGGEIFNTYSGQAYNHAYGTASHSEGSNNSAVGDYSHTEGRGNITQGENSHAEGYGNLAVGESSHVGGCGNTANTDYSTVVGIFSQADGTGENDPKHLFIVGNGASTSNRSNIVEVSSTYLNVNGDIKQNGEPLTTTGYAWAGTQAEWNTLTSAQKAAYDGKEVLITDDSGSNEGVISSLEARIAELTSYATTTVNQLDQSNNLPTGTVTFVRYGNIVLAKGDLYFDVEGNHRQGVTTGSWKVCDIPAGFSASANFYYQIAPQCYQYDLNDGSEKLSSYGIKGVYINLGAVVTGGQVVHSIDFSQIETDGGNPLKTTGYLSTHFYTSWYTDQPFPTNN